LIKEKLKKTQLKERKIEDGIKKKKYISRTNNSNVD
jgi:hypothetical protein